MKTDDDDEVVINFRKEIDYYKKMVVELTGNTIKLQYQMAEMTNEIEQMRKGFSLITGLKTAIARPGDISFLYNYFMEMILILLNMDYAMVLLPERNESESFRPSFIKGYSETDTHKLQNRSVCPDSELQNSKTSLLVNRQTSPTPFIEDLKILLMMPFYIMTPIVFHEQTCAFIVAGKRREMVPTGASRLLAHDVHAMEAIAGVIAAFMMQYEYLELIEKERARISKELHDDIGAELTRITVLTQLLQNQAGIDIKQQEKLKKILEAGKKVFGSIGEIIWTMNRSNDSLESLLAYIRRFVGEYLEMNDIDIQIDFPDEIPILVIHDENRRNIFLVVKEAIHNIAKYSQATKVKISLVIEENTVDMAIHDNGIGFIIGEKQGWGNGLHNMNQRMQDIGGKFTICSSAQLGTQINIRFRLC